MVITRGVQNEDGWWVKSDATGKPFPLDSRLAPIFNEAGVTTLCGALDYGAKTFKSKPCLGTRELLERQKIKMETKTLEKLRLGEYQWKSYDEVKEMADNVGYYMKEVANKKPHDRVAIFAETRADWFIGCMGCLKQRITVCTLYTTLSDEGLIHALNETEVDFVFSSFDLLSRLLKLLKECPKISTVIVMEDQLDGMGDVEFPPGVKGIPFSQICIGVTPSSVETVAKAEDIAIIMYTSGSTGTPKGVELNHSNILNAVIGYSVQMNLTQDDRYIAFLPLAHIMELATEVALVSLGVTIFYSSPHTLTSNSPKIMTRTKGDAKVAKPTLMNAVPLILDRVIKGVCNAVEKQGWIKSVVFQSIVKYKFWIEYIPFSNWVLDYLIFNKVKGELGGEMKRMVVGGAPLSPQTHDKIRAIFGCSLQVGYGSTETSSSITGMDEDDVIPGQVGGPNLGVYVKLQDWGEGGYLVRDKPYPRGEIIVGGTCVAMGYFKRSQETVGSFFEEDEQRWFRTGDIGEIDHSGSLKIIDRKKDLVKLKHGEYVSLGNAESKLKTLPIVDNICVFADPTQETTVAVLVPVHNTLFQIGKNAGIEGDGVTIEELCLDSKVRECILKDLQSHGRKQGLTRWEIPAAVHLTPEVWSPDSGLVTAALKLRRKQLNDHYKNLIREMYARLS